MAAFTNATVESWNTSVHGHVALRLSNEQSHFAQMAGPMGLTIAVCAGMLGRTVNFTTDGERGGFWTNVQITGVN